jgi:hypothetical protein
MASTVGAAMKSYATAAMTSAKMDCALNANLRKRKQTRSPNKHHTSSKKGSYLMPEPTAVQLLTEIRDILKSNGAGAKPKKTYKVGQIVGYKTKKGVKNYEVIEVTERGGITLSDPENDFEFFAKHDKITAPKGGAEDNDEHEEDPPF